MNKLYLHVFGISRWTGSDICKGKLSISVARSNVMIISGGGQFPNEDLSNDQYHAFWMLASHFDKAKANSAEILVLKTPSSMMYVVNISHNVVAWGEVHRNQALRCVPQRSSRCSPTSALDQCRPLATWKGQSAFWWLLMAETWSSSQDRYRCSFKMFLIDTELSHPSTICYSSETCFPERDKQSVTGGVTQWWITRLGWSDI